MNPEEPDPSREVTWEITLEHPDAFVVITAPADASDDVLLSKAIDELTYKTELWNKKIMD